MNKDKEGEVWNAIHSEIRLVHVNTSQAVKVHNERITTSQGVDCWAGLVEPWNVQKPTNVQTTTFVQTFRPQMCKQPHLCKHFALKCANNHICANISPSIVQICKKYINHKCANITPSNVQTFNFDVKCANNIPQMCKSLFSSRISLLQPN